MLSKTGGVQMSANPFNPIFNYKESAYIEEKPEVAEFAKECQDRENTWQIAFLMGIRGSGKTTTITRMKKLLSGNPHVIVVAGSAGDGFNEMALEMVSTKLSYGMAFKKFSIKLPFSDIEIGFGKGDSQSFQYLFSERLRQAQQVGKKVVFLIDEVQNVTPELRRFFVAFSQAVGENLPVVVLAAGLPSTISAVSDDKALTFLHRAPRIVLGKIGVEKVATSYRKIFTQQLITRAQADAMAERTKGCPLIYQTLGYHVWRLSAGNAINQQFFDQAAHLAQRAFFDVVLKKVWRDLSENEMTLLIALHRSGGIWQPRKYMAELNCSYVQLLNMREHLEDCLIIEKSSDGDVNFSVPYFRDFIAELTSGDEAIVW
jgi:hypothetical protein